MVTKYIAKDGTYPEADFHCDNGTSNQIKIQEAINSLSSGDTLHFYSGMYTCDSPIIFKSGVNLEGELFDINNYTYDSNGVFDDLNVVTIKLKSNSTLMSFFIHGFNNSNNNKISNLIIDGNIRYNNSQSGNSYFNLMYINDSCTVENCRFQNGPNDGIMFLSNNIIKNNIFICVCHDTLVSSAAQSDNNIIDNNIIFTPALGKYGFSVNNWWHNSSIKLYAGKNNIISNNILLSPKSVTEPNSKFSTWGILILCSSFFDSSSTQIINNIIFSVRDVSIAFYEFGYTNRASYDKMGNHLIKNNIIYNPQDMSSYSIAIGFMSDKFNPNWNNIYIENNTIVNMYKCVSEETSYGGLSIGTKLAGPVYIKNNIFYNYNLSIGSGIQGTPSLLNSSYNCFYNTLFNSSIAHGQGVSVLSGNIYENPMFVDLQNNNFHLQSGSPAIGSGENNVNIGTNPDFNSLCTTPQGYFNITQQ